MKVKYVGENFGVDALTNGVIYECVGIDAGMLRIIDDSGEDYLYSAINPRPLDGTSKGGQWIIVEDDANNSLTQLIARKTKM